MVAAPSRQPSPTLLSRAANLFGRIFSGIWSILTFPYRLIRSLIFIPIFPAQYMFRPNTERFITARWNLFSTISMNYANYSAKCVGFNLDGHMFDHTNGDGTAFAVLQFYNPENRYFDGIIYAKNHNYSDDQDIVICAVGNASCYEQCVEQHTRLVDDNTVVVAFNAMGVGLSPGKTNDPEDYQAAIKAIIKHFLSIGVPPNRIRVYGTSFGAANLLAVAGQYAEEGMIAVVDRTFARLDTEAAALVSSVVPVVGFLLYYPVIFLINFFSLNFKPADDFNKINRAHPGNAVGFNVPEDKVIPWAASLYNGVEESNRANNYMRKFSPILPEDIDNAHAIPLSALQEVGQSGLKADDFILNTIRSFKTYDLHRAETPAAQEGPEPAVASQLAAARWISSLSSLFSWPSSVFFRSHREANDDGSSEVGLADEAHGERVEAWLRARRQRAGL